MLQQARVFPLKNLANALQKHFEYDQIKLKKIFGWGQEAFGKKKKKKEWQINHKLPSSRRSLKIQRYLFLWKLSHRKFPLFFFLSTDFQTFDKNVNPSKQTRKQRKSLSRLPLAKYLEFFDVPKNSEHINTFREAWLRKSPLQIPKFNFLEQKRVNA